MPQNERSTMLSHDSNAASAANKQLVKDIQEGLASIKVNTQTLLDIQNELKPKG
jgi:hypothetical protein